MVSPEASPTRNRNDEEAVAGVVGISGSATRATSAVAKAPALLLAAGPSAAACPLRVSLKIAARHAISAEPWNVCGAEYQEVRLEVVQSE